jgi:hypothetical protein
VVRDGCRELAHELFDEAFDERLGSENPPVRGVSGGEDTVVTWILIGQSWTA